MDRETSSLATRLVSLVSARTSQGFRPATSNENEPSQRGADCDERVSIDVLRERVRRPDSLVGLARESRVSPSHGGVTHGIGRNILNS